jgi:hypothetical protein
MDTEGRLTAVNKAGKILRIFEGRTRRESVLDFLTPEGADTAKRVLAGEHKA